MSAYRQLANINIEDSRDMTDITTTKVGSILYNTERKSLSLIFGLKEGDDRDAEYYNLTSLSGYDKFAAEPVMIHIEKGMFTNIKVWNDINQSGAASAGFASVASFTLSDSNAEKGDPKKYQSIGSIIDNGKGAYEVKLGMSYKTGTKKAGKEVWANVPFDTLVFTHPKTDDVKTFKMVKYVELGLELESDITTEMNFVFSKDGDKAAAKPKASSGGKTAEM